MAAGRILIPLMFCARAEHFAVLELYTDRACSSKPYQSYHYPPQRLGACLEDPRPGVPDNYWFKAGVVSGHYTVDYYGTDDNCTTKTERRTVEEIDKCIVLDFDYKFHSQKWTIKSSGYYQETVFPGGWCSYKERHLEVYKMVGYCEPFHTSTGSVMSVCEHGEIVQLQFGLDNCTGHSSKMSPRRPPNVCISSMSLGVINHGCPAEAVSETPGDVQLEGPSNGHTKSTTSRQVSVGVGEISAAARVGRPGAGVHSFWGLIAAGWLYFGQNS